MASETMSDGQMRPNWRFFTLSSTSVFSEKPEHFSRNTSLPAVKHGGGEVMTWAPRTHRTPVVLQVNEPRNPSVTPNTSTNLLQTRRRMVQRPDLNQTEMLWRDPETFIHKHVPQI